MNNPYSQGLEEAAKSLAINFGVSVESAKSSISRTIEMNDTKLDIVDQIDDTLNRYSEFTIEKRVERLIKSCCTETNVTLVLICDDVFDRRDYICNCEELNRVLTCSYDNVYWHTHDELCFDITYECDNLPFDEVEDDFDEFLLAGILASAVSPEDRSLYDYWNIEISYNLRNWARA